MGPILEVEKLSIYNVNVLAKNPLLGARVKNTTGKHLLQGPVTVLDAGAYGMALASNYNSRPRPAEVLVDGKSVKVIRRRETISDLLKPEM